MSKCCSVGMWLLMVLSASLSVTSDGGAAVGTSRSERGALKILFWATQGQFWKRQWDIQNEMSDPCLDNWYGIVCDRAGHIKSIRLAQNNLVGSIPPEFARPSLRFLKEMLAPRHAIAAQWATGAAPRPQLVRWARARVSEPADAPGAPVRTVSPLSCSSQHDSADPTLPAIDDINREIQGNQFDTINGEILPEAVKALGRNGRCHLIDR